MKITEQIPKSFTRCPACSIFKHESYFTSARNYVPDIKYCEQCLVYITDTYSQYDETVLKHTKKLPNSPNNDRDSADLFAAFRYFSYHLDAISFPEYGIDPLPSKAILIDAPKSNIADRPVIATFKGTGQRIEFGSLKLATHHLLDSMIFIRSQCLMASLIPPDDKQFDNLSKEDKVITDPSPRSGYQYTFKHLPYHILGLESAEKEHVERVKILAVTALKNDTLDIDEDIIEDPFYDLEDFPQDDIDLDELFDAMDEDD